MNKPLFLLIITVFTCLAVCKSQPPKISLGLKGDSSDFYILRAKVEIIDSSVLQVSQPIVITYLSKRKKRKLSKIKPLLLLSLLNDTKTDWEINLWLYEVYKINAAQFEIIKSKEDWKECCRQKDIHFWTQKLSAADKIL